MLLGVQNAAMVQKKYRAAITSNAQSVITAGAGFAVASINQITFTTTIYLAVLENSMVKLLRGDKFRLS